MDDETLLFEFVDRQLIDLDLRYSDNTAEKIMFGLTDFGLSFYRYLPAKSMVTCTT